MSGRQINPDSGPGALTDPLIGQTVGGRFLITGRVARGGMACVYAAKQVQVNRSVAVKVLRSSLLDSEAAEEFRRRFLREAAMLSQLQHPNLVTLLDYGQISELPGEHYFIAMEYLAGETLAQRLRKRGRLDVAQTIGIARQVGRGLREAHRHGFVHRDLKPSNIMLVPEDDQSDIVKLIDFGIGKVTESSVNANEDEHEATGLGLLLGSPRYMAPEQIRGEAVEPRTDLYGLGIVIFRSLTGRLPFEHTAEVDAMIAHCTTPAPRIDAYVEQPMGSLPDLVAELLHKRVEDRPDVHEFLARLTLVEAELSDILGLAGPTSRTSLSPRVSDAMRPPPLPVIEGVPRSDPPSSRRESQPSSSRQSKSSSLQELASLVSANAELARSTPTAALGPRRAPPWSSRADAMASPSSPPAAVFGGTPSVRPSDPTALSPALAAASLSLPSAQRAPAMSHAKRWTAFVTLAACAAFFVLWWPQKTIPSPSAAPAAPTPSATSETRGAFLLRLDSRPSGAVVEERGVLVGHTPLSLELERATFDDGPRSFVVTREGFVPVTHVQGDSPTDVEATLSLAPQAQETRTPPAPRRRPREQPPQAATAADESTSRPSRVRDKLDINLAR